MKRTLTSLFLVSALYGFGVGAVSGVGYAIGSQIAYATYEETP